MGQVLQREVVGGDLGSVGTRPPQFSRVDSQADAARCSVEEVPPPLHHLGVRVELEVVCALAGAEGCTGEVAARLRVALGGEGWNEVVVEDHPGLLSMVPGPAFQILVLPCRPLFVARVGSDFWVEPLRLEQQADGPS